MESKNVVVCDNGTGVSPPLSLFRSISFLDPPSDPSMRRISGPSFSRSALAKSPPLRAPAWWPVRESMAAGLGSLGIDEFWDHGINPATRAGSY